MQDKKDYRAWIENKLKELDIDIQDITAKAKEKLLSQAEEREHLKRLLDRREELRARLEEAKKSGRDAWGEIRTGADKAFKELQSAFQKAKGKFGDRD